MFIYLSMIIILPILGEDGGGGGGEGGEGGGGGGGMSMWDEINSSMEKLDPIHIQVTENVYFTKSQT